MVHGSIGVRLAPELNPNTALHEVSALLADELVGGIRLS